MDAYNYLGIPKAAWKDVTDENLGMRLRLVPQAPRAAHYVLRRRISSRRNTTIALGERANLDANEFVCPRRRRFTGCEGVEGFEADVGFLGAFLPIGDELSEWRERIPANPPFKYCRAVRIGTAEPPTRRVPGVAVLLPEQHGNLNVGHAAKDLVFLPVL